MDKPSKKVYRQFDQGGIFEFDQDEPDKGIRKNHAENTKWDENAKLESKNVPYQFFRFPGTLFFDQYRREYGDES